MRPLNGIKRQLVKRRIFVGFVIIIFLASGEVHHWFEMIFLG